MKNNYSRPYCEKCNLVYRKGSIGIVLNCEKCKQKLILKDFSPWPKVGSGIAFIALGAFTLLANLPIIWIGGFIAGGILIYQGVETAGRIEDLDQGKEETMLDTKDFVIITCGNCSEKIRMIRNQGIVTKQCFTCKKEFRVRT